MHCRTVKDRASRIRHIHICNNPLPHQKVAEPTETQRCDNYGHKALAIWIFMYNRNTGEMLRHDYSGR
jgi:hypothetical protein